jgi:D-alanine-D-alanine ligase
MRVAFLYNRSADDPAHSAEDEFPDRSPVVAALTRLGHTVTPIACTLDLAYVQRMLLRANPDVVFNRVESLGGSDGMMAAVTLLLDTMQLPYTGNSTAALVATASKVAVKQQLVKAGLPTPAWITSDFGFRILDFGLPNSFFNPQSAIRNPKFILKSDFEHASFEMDDSSIVRTTDEAEICALVRKREAASGRRHFAEEFIEGREFNISVLGDPPQVLPPAEIDFSAFPAGKPRIVGHVAKWDESSFEYNTTERLFEFPSSDEPLLHELKELTLKCWKLFDLTGCARVDFRCDADGRPWILEINTNPCILPEAGFAAALKQAGIGYDEGLQRILEDAVARVGTRSTISAKSTNDSATPRAQLIGDRRAAING